MEVVLASGEIVKLGMGSMPGVSPFGDIAIQFLMHYLMAATEQRRPAVSVWLRSLQRRHCKLLGF
jgi:hypothetical protein